MISKLKFSKLLYLPALACVLLICSCDQTSESVPQVAQVEKVFPESEVNKISIDAYPFNREDPRYLFDATSHSVEELQNLLRRAEEITISQPEGYQNIDIALVLHGPDINLFHKQNYSENKNMVDLAAKLDAFGIIDMKICEYTMSVMELDRSDIPSFIEPVPFVPAEIKRLTSEGYLNL